MLDIHTHCGAPRPLALINIDPSETGDFIPAENQFYSVGIHPWNSSTAPSPDVLERLEKWASMSWCAAVGECGVDMLKGGPLFRQLQIMKHHIVLSERLALPLVIHDVKAHDIIIGLKKEMSPRQPWIIHGFRGKPSVAEMLLKAGLSLSFGERFNPDSLKATPADRIFAETDESPLSIEEIINQMSGIYGEDLNPVICSNISRVCPKTGNIAH